MFIVMAENDASFAMRVEAMLIGILNAVVVRVETVREFEELVPSLLYSPPSLVLLDVYMPWTRMPARQELLIGMRLGVHHRAGIYCKDRLMEHEQMRDVPVLFYTGLSRSDLAPELNERVHYLAKDVTNFQPLLQLIPRICRCL